MNATNHHQKASCEERSVFGSVFRSEVVGFRNGGGRGVEDDGGGGEGVCGDLAPGIVLLWSPQPDHT